MSAGFTRAQINAAATELYGISATYDPAQVTRALEAAAALSAPPADDVREALDGDLARLREVWAALDCEQNPNDFHGSVQETMWTQALRMIREATAQTGRVYRENQQLEEALRAARAALSSPPADDVREASEPEPCSEECGWCGENMPTCLERLAKARAAHRPTARNGWSGCTCGEENPGLTVNLDRWHETHLLSAMADALTAEVRPYGTVTDAERQAVADAIDDTAVITPRNEFLGGSTIANILEVADAALEAAREARS